MKQIVIIGAGGHGKVIADIARCIGYDRISFLDDNKSLTECGGYPVEGTSEAGSAYNCDLFVAVGNPRVRQQIQEKLETAGKNLPVLCHPDAVIGEHVSIGTGSVIMAGTVINPWTTIGKGCIINTCASLDHDNCIGDYAHVSVGAHLAGTVSVGERSWIGIGAVVSNNITITKDCVIGAGAVIIKDIKESGTYVGCPVKKIK